MRVGDGAMPARRAAAGAAERVCSGGRLLASPRRCESACGAGPTGSRCRGGPRAMNAVTPVTPVLEGRDLTKYFWVKQGRGPLARRVPVHAVDRVSVRLDAGKVTAVVGESGAGKTTVGRLLAKIIKPDEGELLLNGRPAPRGRPRSYAAQVQMVFQDPFASLNPVHRIRHHLVRPLQIHHMAGGNLDATVAELLHRVALNPPESFTGKFPHELSGGQRQR